MIHTLLQERKLPELPKTREEMVQILAREEYGPVPPKPHSIDIAQRNTGAKYEHCSGHAMYSEYDITAHMDGFDFTFPVRCIFPKEHPEEGAPAFVLINFRPEVPDWYFPAQEIADNGFAAICVYYNEISADVDDGYSTGVAPDMIKTYGPTSKISMWAWACSCALDFALTRSDIDPNRIAVIGHSRLGKTALWAGANDERFSAVISNDSGCSGAAISRGKVGESIERISRVFPHWFNEKYKEYGNREYEAPFDQHFLLASIAPRKLCVGSASEDTWADPVSEYLCCCAVSHVWEQMGKPGFIHPDRLPVPGDAFQQGSISYHQTDGTHYLGRADWNRYMDFLR
ncbi:MAG: acetylxylan esterase [Clostridia bacterium]|nr:acetylxylan esterase [Clostridia bacterium]